MMIGGDDLITDDSIIVDGNAKINLTLDILGKRPDGYHEVAMVMQSIGLHDTVKLSKIPRGIELVLDVPGLEADEQNLAWRAAQLLLGGEETPGGVRIELTKRIPIAAGLAGGSADAAAVLRGVNALYHLGLTQEELCAYGAKLGSDIPFCIMGGTLSLRYPFPRPGLTGTTMSRAQRSTPTMRPSARKSLAMTGKALPPCCAMFLNVLL